MPSYRFAEFELNEADFCLSRAGHRIALEPKALRVLTLLVSRAGRLVDKQELLESVWPNTFVEENTLTRTIWILRRELGDNPRDSKLIETVPTRGYRFIAPVEVLPDASSTPIQSRRLSEADPDHQHEAEILPIEPSPKDASSRSKSRFWLALIAALCVCSLVGAWLTFRHRATSTVEPKIHSLAVMPLKNLSGDPAQDYLADGMTEEVIGRLSMIRGLRVISRTSVMQFKDTKLLAPEIARTLGVDALVEGSVIREGNRIRVHAQLIRAATDEHFWSETYDRELGDALTLESEVAQSIARRVQATVTGEERARLVAARPVSPEVYEIYLKGLAAKSNTRAEVEQRIAYFDEAVRKDPSFAPAYVGLAQGYKDLGTIFVGAPPGETRPKVISAARKALELDPELADAYVELAGIQKSQWHWTEAEAEYRRALDLDPNNAPAHIGLSDWVLVHGQIEEALAWARRGRELDPLGTAVEDIAGILVIAHRYDEAIRELRNALAIKPDEVGSIWGLGRALVCNHQAAEAIPLLERAASISDRSPAVISHLVWAYAHSGRRADALRVLGELKKRQQAGYVPAGAFVMAYLGLGERDEAFAWLERAYQEQSNLLKYLKVDPVFDSVRGDPRFQDLVRRVGLS
jgi:TolB-like protein/DNA-binding winged helix-turn-helix (wHTH) protein/tetratricopeptide (TPR) repeat protein